MEKSPPGGRFSPTMCLLALSFPVGGTDRFYSAFFKLFAVLCVRPLSNINKGGKDAEPEPVMQKTG